MKSELEILIEKGEDINRKIEDAEMNNDFASVEKYDKELKSCLIDISDKMK